MEHRDEYPEKIVEGMLALTGQKFLLGTVRTMGILPGFYSGFTAIARDESRHVNFGVRALMEAGVRDPALLDRAVEVVFRILEPAVRTVAAPDRKFAVKPEEVPEQFRVNPYEIREFSLNSLIKRLRVAGVAEETLEEIHRRGISYYDTCWAEYEENNGEEHPYRFYDRMAAAAG